MPQNRIVADGAERRKRAEYDRIEHQVREKFAAQVAAAGIFRRCILEYRIWTEIRAELRKLAPLHSLWISSRP
ncbi:MAG TPA: hypothetical protein VEH04_14800 [Verrucomicrobiae bacterium]|nr:hypothetical protein [Verrucomicrobiae bacterium]